MAVKRAFCFRFHQQPPDSDGALGEGDLKRYFDDLVDDVDAWRLRFGKKLFLIHKMHILLISSMLFIFTKRCKWSIEKGP